MRLAVTKNQYRNADILCDEARHAKRYLQYSTVTQMIVDHYLSGRENGYQFIVWAISRCLAPRHIVLTERDIQRRNTMDQLLVRNGYRSVDGINFTYYQ